MKAALTFLTYSLLFLLACTILSFAAFWLQSDSLTIGGELLFVFTIPVFLYYCVMFFLTKTLLKKDKPSLLLTIVLYVVSFWPLLFAVIDVEAFFEFIFSGIHLDMK